MKLIKINTGLIMCEYSHNLEFFFFIFICLFILTFYEEHRDSLQAFLLKEKGHPDQTSSTWRMHISIFHKFHKHEHMARAMQFAWNYKTTERMLKTCSSLLKFSKLWANCRQQCCLAFAGKTVHLIFCFGFRRSKHKIKFKFLADRKQVSLEFN